MKEMLRREKRAPMKKWGLMIIYLQMKKVMVSLLKLNNITWQNSFFKFYSGEAGDMADLSGDLYKQLEFSLASGDHGLQIKLLQFLV